MSLTDIKEPPQRYTYFHVVVGLVCADDPTSHAGSSTATDRAFHVRQVKGDDPDKKEWPGPPGWGLDVGLTTPRYKFTFCWEASKTGRG